MSENMPREMSESQAAQDRRGAKPAKLVNINMQLPLDMLLALDSIKTKERVSRADVIRRAIRKEVDLCLKQSS